MATSMRRVGMRVLSGRLSLKLRTSSVRTSSYSVKSNSPSSDLSGEVEYPPVKPKYPPGKWGKITPKQAWEIHDEAEEILKEPKVKMRLEKIAGSWQAEKPFMYGLSLMSAAPGTLPYRQYVTKTHLIEGLPELYNEVDSNPALEQLRSSFVDAIEYEADLYNYAVDKNIVLSGRRFYFAHGMLGRFLNIAMSGMSTTYPHLRRAQLGERVRVETIWKRCGYSGDKAKGIVGVKYGDIVNFQLKHLASYQVRTELPLPEILPMEDPLCQLGSVPDHTYSPKVAGEPFTKDRPITMSGHWVGDPCEFGHLTVQVLGNKYDTMLEDHGDKHLDQESLCWGLTAGFGNTLSQAHNQGFFHWKDVTYPFVNQVLVTDGQWFRFLVYQLNTLHLWKDDECHPTRNILWASPRMKLYDAIEDGQVKGLNDNALRQFLQCLAVKPQDRGVDLRPYLPNEPAPGLTKKHINHLGEGPLSHHKIGRFEYPRNAVYF